MTHLREMLTLFCVKFSIVILHDYLEVPVDDPLAEYGVAPEEVEGVSVVAVTPGEHDQLRLWRTLQTSSTNTSEN